MDHKWRWRRSGAVAQLTELLDEKLMKKGGNHCSVIYPFLFFFFHLKVCSQFRNILDSTSNRLKQCSLWSGPSESSSFVLPLAALAWKHHQSGEHCGRSANGSHGEENKHKPTHVHAETHRCVATPFASSVVLQSKENPWPVSPQQSPFFCTTCLCCNMLYS